MQHRGFGRPEEALTSSDDVLGQLARTERDGLLVVLLWGRRRGQRWRRVS